jgi:hypothetical protein
MQATRVFLTDLLDQHVEHEAGVINAATGVHGRVASTCSRAVSVGAGISVMMAFSWRSSRRSAPLSMTVLLTNRRPYPP